MKRYTKQTDFFRNTWWICVFLFLIFPPLGVVYFIIRAFLEKKLHKLGEDTLFGPAFASILWGIFAMGLVLLTLSNSDFWAITLFLPALLCGVGMLLIRRKYRRLDERCRLCQTIVNKGHLRELEKIAECLSDTTENTANFLQQMVEQNLLPGCRVDKIAGILQIEAEWARKQIICPKCSAEIEIDVGIDLICPYCGAAIE